MANLHSYLQNVSKTTFSSLYIRNYRYYYIGQIISTSGTFLQSVAQTWLVLQLTKSGTALGIVPALQFLPILVLGPFGGLVADRVSKRKILFFTQAASGLLALTLGTLVATSLVRVWHVYLLAFGLGLVNTFDNPTRQTFYIELVGPDHLRNAITLYSILINLSRIIGPTIAGALIASVGLAPCFFINGISYISVLIMLARMHSDELIVTPPVPPLKGQLKEGFQYALNTPVIASILLMVAIIGTLTFEFNVTLPLIAHETFHGDARSYAFLTASMGVGAAVGGIFFASRKNINFNQVIWAALLFGTVTLAAAFMPSLPLVGLALVFVGIGSINYSTSANSLLQLESSPQMRGRIMSFWTIGFLGLSTFGGPFVGWFAETMGARLGLALGGAAALLAAALGAISVRYLQRKPLKA